MVRCRILELEFSTEPRAVATARRVAQRRALLEAAANEEIIVEENEELDESDTAMVDAYRQSLITAKRVRLTNSSTDLARIVEVPRNAFPPTAVVQTALFNMQEAVVLMKNIDTPLEEKFRDQAKRPAFQLLGSNKKDMFAPFRNDPQDNTFDLLDKITISGSPEQQKRIREFCDKYRHIFKDELDATPATLTPFELDVDKKKWETYKNRGHVRVQSAVKEAEINKQVNEMLKAGIIEKSNATYYSQVMLTPKPNGTYRFCVDYRNMNDATESASWPIPNIAGLLACLGRQKADTFGVMDSKSGNRQAPLSLATRVFTAFITFAGVYHFTRLPFGPKRAPSYFQQEMGNSNALHMK